MEKIDTKKSPVDAVGFANKNDILNALEYLYKNIITQKEKISKLENKEKGKKSTKKPPKKILNINGVVKTLNLKFYAEQLIHDYMTYEELLKYYNDLKANYNYMIANNTDKTMAESENSNDFDFLFERLKERVISTPDDFQVSHIIHDSDTVVDSNDFFLASALKPHAHMVIKRKDNKAFRINTILNRLGLKYRRYIDNELWGYSVQTCGNFAASIAYLTHETPDAEKSGKYIYDRDNIVSNIDKSTIDDFREGYLISQEKRKITEGEMAILDQKFYDQGYALKDFDVLYDSLGYRERKNSGMRTIKESYQRGVNKRLSTDEPEITRVCLFIKGEPNTGKTYSLNQALKELDYKTYKISGGGSGKFDKLKMSDQAILIDDEVCPNLLNLTDSRVTTVYKRNKNNPCFTGSLFVVTSNLDLFEWCQMSGLNVYNFGSKENLNQHGQAIKTRFIQFKVININGTNQIVLDDDLKNLRGTLEEQKTKIEMSEKIINKANFIMKNYKPINKEIESDVDYKINIDGEECSYKKLKENFEIFLKDLSSFFFIKNSEIEKMFLENYNDGFFKWLNKKMPDKKIVENYYQKNKKEIDKNYTFTNYLWDIFI